MKNRMIIELLTTILLMCVAPVKLQEHNYYIAVFNDSETTIRFDFYPCTGDDNHLFELNDFPRHTQNPYLVLIRYDYPKNSEALVTLSSPATVYFEDIYSARIAETSNYTITFRFVQADTIFGFLILRSKPSVLPYVANLVVDGTELCINRTNTIVNQVPGPGEGIQDRYIERYKDYLHIELPVPESFCGTRKVAHTGLIVSGLPTKPGDWPWHAALFLLKEASFEYKCGATLISKYFVLTAAHCVVDNGAPIVPDIVSVVLGKYNLRGIDNTAVEKEIHEIIVHEKYKPILLSNDIALLKMATKVEYNDYIQPACLWHSSLNFKIRGDIFGNVVGWGIDHTDQLSRQLQHIQIPMIEDVLCLRSNRGFFGRMLDENKFCAGYQNGTSACNGDSGGGFTVSIEGRHHIRGIVSTAVAIPNENKCDPNNYVLFTDVEKYILWIRSNTKQ